MARARAYARTLARSYEVLSPALQKRITQSIAGYDMRFNCSNSFPPANQQQTKFSLGAPPEKFDK